MIALFEAYGYEAIFVAALAAVLGDSVTYWLGRRVGMAGERRLVGLYRAWTACTLGSARCVARAEGLLRRFRGWVVLVAKFIAGARVFMPPVAGVSGLSYGRFLIFAAAGSLLWTTLVVAVGVLIIQEWEGTARGLEQAYRLAAVALVALLGGYVAWKFTRRRRHGSAPLRLGTASNSEAARRAAERLPLETRCPS